MVMCCAMLPGGIATQKSCSRPSRRCNTNQQLGDAVRVVRFVPGYMLMRICGGFPCCSLCGYQTPAACGATWMKETLYHWVAKNVQRDLCGIITSEIHHPLMQCIFWYVSKLDTQKTKQFSERPKKTPQPCSLLLFSDSLCVIVRCFSTTWSLETRFGHAAVMVNCWAFEQFHGG